MKDLGFVKQPTYCISFMLPYYFMAMLASGKLTIQSQVCPVTFLKIAFSEITEPRKQDKLRISVGLVIANLYSQLLLLVHASSGLDLPHVGQAAVSCDQ